MREIVLDTETTGLDPVKGDRIVEIGCVEMVNRFLTGRTFHQYINPERSMPPDAFKVHGLSDRFLADKPKFAEIADAFVEFIGDDSTLVIHNAAFDISFLNHELGKLRKPSIPSERVTCSLMLARRKHPGQPNSLDALCERYGIDNSRRTKHGALLDSEILAEVYGELTGGRQQTMALSQVSAGVSLADTARRRNRVPPPSLLTAEEIASHRAFIETMGDKALWRSYLGMERQG